jgi:hypothetical protein
MSEPKENILQRNGNFVLFINLNEEKYARSFQLQSLMTNQSEFEFNYYTEEVNLLDNLPDNSKWLECVSRMLKDLKNIDQKSDVWKNFASLCAESTSFGLEDRLLTLMIFNLVWNRENPGIISWSEILDLLIFFYIFPTSSFSGYLQDRLNKPSEWLKEGGNLSQILSRIPPGLRELFEFLLISVAEKQHVYIRFILDENPVNLTKNEEDLNDIDEDKYEEAEVL